MRSSSSERSGCTVHGSTTATYMAERLNGSAHSLRHVITAEGMLSRLTRWVCGPCIIAQNQGRQQCSSCKGGHEEAFDRNCDSPDVPDLRKTVVKKKRGHGCQ